MPILYLIDSNDKIRMWSVKAVNNTTVVTHGMDGGKLQEKVTVCKGKNIGKSNETTPEEQAVSEAISKWEYQKQREDYSEDPLTSGKQIRPMLALDYRKVSHRVNWSDTIAQPKLDGLRLVSGYRTPDIKLNEMMTRKGESYVVPHLVTPSKDLLDIVNELCDNKCYALDGELYVHGISLQKISSWAKKYKKSYTEQLNYHLFDLIIPDMTFMERYDILEKAIEEYANKVSANHQFVLVENFDISKEAEMKQAHGFLILNGYEGVMIRHKSSQYKIAKRSADLFKYKQFFDTEAKITSVWEDNNGNAMLTVLLKNGVSCDVTPKRTHAERKEMLANSSNLIDKWITVKYQAETDDGSLQFPIGMDMRECDSNGEPLV